MLLSRVREFFYSIYNFVEKESCIYIGCVKEWNGILYMSLGIYKSMCIKKVKLFLKEYCIFYFCLLSGRYCIIKCF